MLDAAWEKNRDPVALSDPLRRERQPPASNPIAESSPGEARKIAGNIVEEAIASPDGVRRRRRSSSSGSVRTAARSAVASYVAETDVSERADILTVLFSDEPAGKTRLAGATARTSHIPFIYHASTGWRRKVWPSPANLAAGPAALLHFSSNCAKRRARTASRVYTANDFSAPTIEWLKKPATTWQNAPLSAASPRPPRQETLRTP